MRIIKFRAWRTDEKYMVTSDVGALTALRNCYGNKGLAEQAGFSNIDNQPNPDKFILMQYTGLKDKNGKEIYEGDILKWKCSKSGSRKELIHIVTIGWNGFRYVLTIYDNGEKWATNKSYWNDSDREVIGNIYENPELLEGKE
jgi:uncharacterized phage protein (TIGR01671 family)